MAGESSRYASFEALTRKHGFVCITASEIDMDKLIVVVGEIIGIENVEAVSRMNKKIVFFVSQVPMVVQVVERGLFFDPDIYVPFPPLDTPAKKVVISNLPPFIKCDQIVSQLKRYGTVVTPLTMIPFRRRNDKFKHIMSFSRIVYMILPPGVSGFQAILPFKIEGHTYMGYANTETLVCYGCGEFGHVKRSCPKGMPNKTVNEGSSSQQLPIPDNAPITEAEASHEAPAPTLTNNLHQKISFPFSKHH